MDIIGIIIVIWVVYKIRKAAVVKQSTKGRVNPVPNTPANGSIEERRKQADIKRKLQEKVGERRPGAQKTTRTVKSSQNHQNQSVYAEAADERGEDDILTMANAQVDKQHKDDQERIRKESGRDRKVASFGYSREKTDSMKKVQDRMITGYSGDLNFKRDFIAEGVEMMNRFADTKYIEN